jgi:hypothetical protein
MGDDLQVEATFRAAECLYELERFSEASDYLGKLYGRSDLPMARRLSALVQQGVCQLEEGGPSKSKVAEGNLRKALDGFSALEGQDEVDSYFPAQAHFFLGEIYRQHYESVTLQTDQSASELAKELEYKAELLLSAQGHYLRALRVGHPHWTTASGARIGELYQNFYQYLVKSPVPKELSPNEASVYRVEVKKRVRVLLSKAINVYERTLETAERLGTSSPFVERTRQELEKMKQLLSSELQREDEEHS